MKLRLFLKYLVKKEQENNSAHQKLKKFIKYFLLRSPILLYRDALIWNSEVQKKEKFLPFFKTISPAREKDTILICTHEFSFTGVPILALNLAKYFSKKYHVILVGFGKGSLLKYFELPSVTVVVPDFDKNDFESMGLLLDEINTKFPIKFCIAATIECYSLPPAAAALGISTLCLVNEYAGIYSSKAYFDISLLWSDYSIFSSNFLLDNALNHLDTFKGENTYVIPQGKCEIPVLSLTLALGNENQKSASSWAKLKKSLNQSKLILGVGSITYRKGVDIFIQCAYELSRMENGGQLKFLWVGDGMENAADASYPLFLLDEIDKFRLNDSFHFIGSMDSLDDVYQTADVMMVTSRVDPLPNVAIDAMLHGIPFVYFDQATGISDELDALIGDKKECFKAKYLDSKDMASKAHVMLSNAIDPLVLETKNKSIERFNFNIYAEKLEAFYPDLQLKKQNLLNNMVEILSDPIFRIDFFSLDPNTSQWPNENVARYYLKSWSAKMARRKPFPGFNPAIYADINLLLPTDGDPYAHYLKAKKPLGAWIVTVIPPKNENMSTVQDLNGVSVALHIHAFYPELFPAIIERLRLNNLCPDLFISLGDEGHIKIIESHVKNYPGKVKKIIVCPNVGRDIGPLITEFGSEISSGYSYFGHIHTKATKYLDSPIHGEIWYNFLLENLLGGQGGAMADNIFSYMLQNPDLELVFPDDPNVIGWDQNRQIAEKLAAKLGVKDLPSNFNFPVGTMFWAKTDVLKKLISLNLNWSDYPDEPLPNDGTILHAIERIIPFLTSSPGSGYAVTNVPGITR